MNNQEKREGGGRGWNISNITHTTCGTDTLHHGPRPTHKRQNIYKNEFANPQNANRAQKLEANILSGQGPGAEGG